MLIPGLGRINKKISAYIGNSRKKEFEKFISTSDFANALKIKLQSKTLVNLELVTFADANNFADLVLSVLSFVSSVGIPSRWTVYADDEFSEAQKSILNQLKFLVFREWFTNVSSVDKKKYSGKWQYRKYLSFSMHAFTGTTIFLDSDVVFYECFEKYTQFIKEANWYLPEPTDAFSMDTGVISRPDYKPTMYIINAGFMIFNKMPPWNLGLAYLNESLSDNSGKYFIDQSALNIVYSNDPSAKILEPRVFHVSTVDHFKTGFLKTTDLAIRHYVGPIRFKMWQAGWKQFI